VLSIYSIMYVIGDKKKPDRKEKHEHRWHVVSDHWQCEVCGKIFGLK